MLETTINNLQTTGIFEHPEFIGHPRLYRLHEQRTQKTPPLVVTTETYYRSGLLKKLQIGEDYITLFAEEQLLRPQTGNFEFTGPKEKQPLNTLSLAQTISWLYQQPIETILHTPQQIKTLLRKQPIEERLNLLFRAYTGSRWFESFILKQHRMIHAEELPKIREEQKITSVSLQHWLYTSS